MALVRKVGHPCNTSTRICRTCRRSARRPRFDHMSKRGLQDHGLTVMIVTVTCDGIVYVSCGSFRGHHKDLLHDCFSIWMRFIHSASDIKYPILTVASRNSFSVRNGIFSSMAVCYKPGLWRCNVCSGGASHPGLTRPTQRNSVMVWFVPAFMERLRSPWLPRWVLKSSR